VPQIQGELRSYQLRGVAWLISLWTNGMNGILADQMGLGKTVQTVAFLSHLRDNSIIGPFLIVVPLSTLMNWQKEVKRWCPSMDALIFHGTRAERAKIEKKWFKPEYSRALCPHSATSASQHT
jgi:ATP-dependent DNA helicase